MCFVVQSPKVRSILKLRFQLKFLTFILTLSLLVAKQQVQPAGAVSLAESTTERTAVIETVLIHFQEGTSEAARQQFYAEIQAELVHWIAPLNVAKVRISGGSHSLDEINMIGGASDESPVTTVELDGEVHGTFTANDPDLYDEQRTYAHDLLELNNAWDYSTGSAGTVIAVLDTGIASAHPEFSGRILDGYDFYNNDDDPEDDHGHGSHVSGTAAAAINNGLGAAGLCGGCSILPVKVLNENNAGTWSGVASGIVFAADQGADVIVMSLGSTSGTQVVENAINYALGRDVIIVAAAGNANSNRKFYPAAYEGVIGVAATDRNDQRWALSNYGSYVDVSAPGHLIYSTFNDLDNSYDGHVFMSGTSMATPHVGGLAGLIRSVKPSLSHHEVADIIQNSALDLGESGWDEMYGHGRINPAAALAQMPDSGTASIAGTIWLDTNANGRLDGSETERFENVSLTLLNSGSNNAVVASTSSDNNGNWKFTDLSAGSYRLLISSETENIISTTPQQLEVQLKRNENRKKHDLGYVGELPASAVGETYVSRSGAEITLYWDGLSKLVTGMVLERSAPGKDYEVIGQLTLDAESVGARSLTSYTDILPKDLEGSTVLYRIQVLPGESYLEEVKVDLVPQTAQRPPATVQLPPANETIFLPWVVR